MNLEPMEKGESKKSGSPLPALLVFLVFLALAGVAFWKFFEREAPQAGLLTDVATIGLSKEISLAATDEKSGIRTLDVVIFQNGKETSLVKKVFERQGYFGRAGAAKVEEKFTVDSRSLGLQDGPAELIIAVRDFSWWNWFTGNVTAVRYTAVLDTSPPKVTVLESPRLIKSGNSGVVMYKISEPAAEHGVMINDDFHPGFPLPHRGQDVYGAMIGMPYDLEKIDKSSVRAVDPAGNTGMAVFSMIYRPLPLKKDKIEVSDGFLNAKLPEFASYYPDLAGEPIEQYLRVNREIRAQNYVKVREVCARSKPERLWEGRFERMPGSTKANFAEHRTYYYNGAEIDQQVHLGIDIAALEKFKVEAANRGVVVYADYLGIYGNTVILDHGQGMFTLYSHMSQIQAVVNDQVEKGTVLGQTGSTGMAGGDHLHFSILVNGIFVNPIEWWDEHWIKDNLLHVL